MPTYKNETTSPISWGANHWKPGESKGLSFFVPYSDLGLTKTADTPTVPGLFMAGSGDKTVAAGTPLTVEVPYPSQSGKFMLSVIVTSGEVDLKLGTGETEAALDTSKMYYRENIPWNRCNSLTLTSAEGATVKVTMEEA